MQDRADAFLKTTLIRSATSLPVALNGVLPCWKLGKDKRITTAYYDGVYLVTGGQKGIPQNI